MSKPPHLEGQNFQISFFIYPGNADLFTLKATVYGKRDACLHGLAVVHRDKLNIFRSSDGWKHGLIRDCAMLPRSSMFKPDVPSF